ncbi:hypothetical protein D3C81_2309820 [compost metagenome]
MQQLKRSLLAYSGYAGNIITGIAHETFKIDNLLRGKIIFLADLLRPVELDFGYTFTDQRYGCMF